MLGKHAPWSKRHFIKIMRELANTVERRQRRNPAKPYDQEKLVHECGAPACLLGHFAPLYYHHGSIDSRRSPLTRAAYRQQGDRSARLRMSARVHCRGVDFFGAFGCDNAGADWQAAVKFIRDHMNALEAGYDPATLTP